MYSVQTLTCEVNTHRNVIEIPPLTTVNAQFNNVNWTQTTSALVQCQAENGSRTVGCESLPVEQRLRGKAVPRKTIAGTEILQSIQRDREMRSVRFVVVVELLAEGGLHRKASRKFHVRTSWHKSFADFKSPEQNRRRWYSRER